MSRFVTRSLAIGRPGFGNRSKPSWRSLLVTWGFVACKIFSGNTSTGAYCWADNRSVLTVNDPVEKDLPPEAGPNTGLFPRRTSLDLTADSSSSKPAWRIRCLTQRSKLSKLQCRGGKYIMAGDETIATIRNYYALAGLILGIVGVFFYTIGIISSCRNFKPHWSIQSKTLRRGRKNSSNNWTCTGYTSYSHIYFEVVRIYLVRKGMHFQSWFPKLPGHGKRSPGMTWRVE